MHVYSMMELIKRLLVSAQLNAPPGPSVAILLEARIMLDPKPASVSSIPVLARDFVVGWILLKVVTDGPILVMDSMGVLGTKANDAEGVLVVVVSLVTDGPTLVIDSMGV